MRSFVAAPMRHGRLFLAGDAAHIVPPTGAKGLNLALSDVAVLANALRAALVDKNWDQADAYSDTCLDRVWRATHFSWWMTSMLHVNPEADAFDEQLMLNQLRYVTSSKRGRALPGGELHRLPAGPLRAVTAPTSTGRSNPFFRTDRERLYQAKRSRISPGRGDAAAAPATAAPTAPPRSRAGQRERPGRRRPRRAVAARAAGA